MAQKNNSDDTTLYDKVKRRIRNSWIAVGLLLIAGALAFSSNVLDSLNKLGLLSKTEPPISMTANIVDDRLYCAGFSIEPGEDLMTEKAVLDVAVNNVSKQTHIIKSAKIIPLWITASFLAGELQVSKTYNVLLDDWAALAKSTKIDDVKFENLKNQNKAKREDNEVWIQPDILNVKEIVENKYAIPAETAERFQIKLGLSDTNDYLYGKVQFEIKTDLGATIVSEPLWITVCHSSFKVENE